MDSHATVRCAEIALAVLNVVVYGACLWAWRRAETQPSTLVCPVCGSLGDALCVGRPQLPTPSHTRVAAMATTAPARFRRVDRHTALAVTDWRS